MKDTYLNLVKSNNMNKGKFRGNEEKLQKLLTHSEKVYDIALDICGSMNSVANEDIRLIKVATLLHDICKYEEDHNKVGAKFLEDNLEALDKENTYTKEEKRLICLMVRWHKSKKYRYLFYSDKEIMMIEIIRSADKIAKLYKKKKYKLEEVYKKVKAKLELLQNENVKKGALEVLEKRYKEMI